MKRDGASISLWQDGEPDYKTEIISLTNKTFDVLIVGGGITGITAGLLLQRAGKSVMIAEAHNIGFGTTGGTTAHINNFFDSPYDQVIKNFGEDKGKLLAKAAHQALSLIKKHVEEFEIACGYKELSGYVYSQDKKQSKELEDIFDASKKAGIDVNYSKNIPVTIPFEKAIEFKQQAQFHPTQYIYALAKEFEKSGGVLIENCRITGVEENEILDISSNNGSFKAKNLIYATHIPPGVNLLHFRCAPYRSYAMAIKLKNKNNYPGGLAYDMYDPYHYFRTQEVDGEKYFIAGGEDHKTAHEENTEACFTRLEGYVRKFYDVDSIAFRWSSQYFEPVDGLPYIGHLPGHPQNMYVATGYGGNGMTYSAIAALTLTEMIVNNKSEYEKLFDPNRIKPVAGFSNFVKEAADVTGNLIGGIFPKEKLEELADLAPGEARVIKYEGHSVALYKDEEGNLHAVNPACSHIKCTVGWNAVEKSWDCPCHGSRFSYNGEVLTAPARKDLAIIHLEELIEH
jgi:glycine/D-amino acid oxidase-like deaminating enzyme/nitrite reductase/ring-hydroxylating ferredoxin subunit